MAASKPTGAALADQIRAAGYDRDFLNGFLVTFVGKIADGETEKSARAAARDVLESLADSETFFADVPVARRSR